MRDLNIFDDDISDKLISDITAEYFNIGWKDISTLFDKAASKEIFSSTAEKEWEHLQDIFFFYIYLYLLNWERKDMYEINGIMPTREELYTSYRLDEVRRYFACKYIEVVPLYAEFDTAIPQGLFDGIGYMYIEEGNPEFIVK